MANVTLNYSKNGREFKKGINSRFEWHPPFLAILPERSRSGALRGWSAERSGAPESLLEREVERRSDFKDGARSGAALRFLPER